MSLRRAQVRQDTTNLVELARDNVDIFTSCLQMSKTRAHVCTYT